MVNALSTGYIGGITGTSSIASSASSNSGFYFLQPPSNSNPTTNHHSTIMTSPSPLQPQVSHIYFLNLSDVLHHFPCIKNKLLSAQLFEQPFVSIVKSGSRGLLLSPPFLERYMGNISCPNQKLSHLFVIF